MPTSHRLTNTSPAIAYETHGDGPPLVFVHGIGGNRRNWDDQLELFSRHYQVITLDLRGYGDSDPIPGNLQFEHFAQDVFAVLDELGLERAHCVGLSMGGLVVQMAYAQAPQRVLSLTLAACRPGDAPVAEGEQFARDRLEPLRSPRPLEALADSLLPKLIGPNTAPEIIARLRESLMRLRLEDYQQNVQVRTQLRPFLSLADVKVPTLVVGGQEDKLAPPSQMQAIVQSVPHSQLKLIEDCGHFVNIEQADIFNETLYEFLTRIKGS